MVGAGQSTSVLIHGLHFTTQCFVGRQARNGGMTARGKEREATNQQEVEQQREQLCGMDPSHERPAERHAFVS